MIFRVEIKIYIHYIHTYIPMDSSASFGTIVSLEFTCVASNVEANAFTEKNHPALCSTKKL